VWHTGKIQKKSIICFGLEKQNGFGVSQCIVRDSEIKMHIFDQDLNPRSPEHNVGLLTSPLINFILATSPKVRCSEI